VWCEDEVEVAVPGNTKIELWRGVGESDQGVRGERRSKPLLAMEGCFI
jgi:hypothetical protein